MEPIFDKAQARRQMVLLGLNVKQTIWQTWPDRDKNEGVALTSTNLNDLQVVLHQGGNAGFALAKFPQETLNGKAERKVEFIREKGGAFDVLAAEWDDHSTLEEQQERIREAQLPDPSVSVFTGGKSHHHYWLLDEFITIEQFEDLQKRLAQRLGSDSSISSGDQILRVAGFPHSKTGKLAEVVFPADDDAARYSVDEFSDLPPLVEQAAPKVAAKVTATPTDLDAAVRDYLIPVAENFSGYHDWLKTGMAFHSLGDGYLALWKEFCSAMKGFDEAECLEKWLTFDRIEGGVGPGSLYYWLSQQGWRGGDDLKQNKPIASRLELLSEGLKEVAESITSTWKRRAHADDLNDALGKPVNGKGLDQALAERSPQSVKSAALQPASAIHPLSGSLKPSRRRSSSGSRSGSSLRVMPTCWLLLPRRANHRHWLHWWLPTC